MSIRVWERCNYKKDGSGDGMFSCDTVTPEMVLKMNPEDSEDLYVTVKDHMSDKWLQYERHMRFFRWYRAIKQDLMGSEKFHEATWGKTPEESFQYWENVVENKK